MVVLKPRPKKKKAQKVFGDRRGLGFRHLVVKPANLGKVLFWRQRKPPKPRHGKHTFNRGSLGFWPIKYWPVVDNGHLLLWRQRKPPKPVHNKRTFNGTSLGFWPIPDNGYIGSAAVTLRMLSVAAAGHLEYPSTGAITLPVLRVYGEARFGPDDTPGTVTLKPLTVSGTGFVTAPATITHAVLRKYNARGGGPVVSWLQNYAGSRQVQIKRTVPALTVDQQFDISILSSTAVALALYSTQDVIVKLNSGHTQTINLSAQEGLIWTNDSGESFPFTSDVSALFVSNPNQSDASFTVAALILDASN